jgi:hypothetical protein
MSIMFQTILRQAEGKNATGISVPTDIVTALNGGKRPKVVITINQSYTYRTTIAPYGEVFLLPVSSEHRQGAGIKAGDSIEVTLALDIEPRIVEVPDDLAEVLAQAGVQAKFDASSTSVRKEFVRQVTEAKTAETRERRIANIVSKLHGE